MVFFATTLVSGQERQFHKLPIRRLPPRAFPNLPRNVARALQKGGYTVPQLWVDPHADLYGKPHNVVKGSFRRRGQVDWAVLCSRHDSSAIVIFWGGNPSDTTALAYSCDDDWTQSINEHLDLGFSRELLVASPRRILDHNSPPERVSRMHDGIEDYFDGKASSIYYLKSGRWLDLAGAD